MKKSVAILGCGISGLETAKNLISSNKFDVKIFEASTDFGGRIKKKEGFCDYTLELGAEEIHGINSEYYKTVIKYEGKVLEYWDLNKIYCCYNPTKGKESKLNLDKNQDVEKNNDKDKNISDVHLIKDDIKLENMYDLASKYPEIKFMDNLFEDISYEVSLKNLPNISLKEYLIFNKIPEESFFYADALIGSESGTDMNHVSIKGFSKVCEEWESGTENLILLNMSHYDILKKNYENILAKSNLNITDKNTVKENDILIQYDTQIVEIIYEDKNKIRLFDQNKINYDFDLCIISIPLPQYKKIKFSPVLSLEKLNSLNNIGFDSVGKLFLKFNKRLWPEDAVVLILPGLGNFYWPSNTGKISNDFVLNCLIGGENCKTLTQLYKEDNNKFLEKLFDSFKISLGENAREHLIDFIWFDWSEMPFIGGGYSFISVKENDDDRFILEEPIEDRIFFVGEAFAKNGHISTIHGAMENAIELSKNIIKKY